eukprot:jgi/Mesen1/2263/ME000153S01475
MALATCASLASCEALAKTSCFILSRGAASSFSVPLGLSPSVSLSSRASSFQGVNESLASSVAICSSIGRKINSLTCAKIKVGGGDKMEKKTKKAKGAGAALEAVAVESPAVAESVGEESDSDSDVEAAEGPAKEEDGEEREGGVESKEKVKGEKKAQKKVEKDAKKAAKRDNKEKEKEKKKGKGKKALSAISFVKYQGLGNDFLLVDNRDAAEPKLTPEQSARLCDRNFGVGGDGVIFALPGSDGAEYTMRIYNSDGSEPEMCGNGIRCMARFVADLEGASHSSSYTISTLAGPIVPHLLPDGQVKVDMGQPILNGPDVPTTLAPTAENGAVVNAPLEIEGTTWRVTCVSMGNPHCVTFSQDGQEGLDVEAIELARIGPLFENNSVFPARINTEFVEVVSRTELKMKVWERGAGATLACGTGACALLVAAVLEGRAERKCVVHLPGGPLEIEWREDDNRVYMTGPAVAVFSGEAFL